MKELWSEFDLSDLDYGDIMWPMEERNVPSAAAVLAKHAAAMEAAQAEQWGPPAKRRREDIPRVRKRALDTVFQYRARGEVSWVRWARLLEDDFELSQPVTPYRSYDPRDVARTSDGARRVSRGIQGMIFDTASFAVMLQSIGVRCRRGHKLLRCKFELDDDGLLFDGDKVMGLWRMRTLNATQCGAKSECSKQGMLRAVFASSHKLKRLELYFDVLAFMRDLRVARDSPSLENVPNTLDAARRLLQADDAPPVVSSGSLVDEKHRPQLKDAPRARVITLANRPHLITQVNRDFVDLAGFAAGEALGRSLRIIQGPATDQAVVGDLLADVARQLPASMIVVNYRRNGERFINYLRVFPLVDTDRGITHFFGELERLDDQTVVQIENTSSPEWKMDTMLPDDDDDDDDLSKPPRLCTSPSNLLDVISHDDHVPRRPSQQQQQQQQNRAKPNAS